jgi:hypothetical protein
MDADEAGWAIHGHAPLSSSCPQQELKFLSLHSRLWFLRHAVAALKQKEPAYSQYMPALPFCLVGAIGVEPTTSSMSPRRSNQLSYAPLARDKTDLPRRPVRYPTGQSIARPPNRSGHPGDPARCDAVRRSHRESVPPVRIRDPGHAGASSFPAGLFA